MNNTIAYPYLKEYSKETGREVDILIEAFKIEKRYHQELMNEPEAKKRELIYKEFYQSLLPLYQTQSNHRPENKKAKLCELFSKELTSGNSLIDFGCGNGNFLQILHNTKNFDRLTGVDIYISDQQNSHGRIEFIESGIIDFKTHHQYHIAFSDNVIEHLAPADLTAHIKTIYDSLEVGGKFILIMPNRLFGPSDITRVKDNSFSGKLVAEGGHLNESTYCDMIAELENQGFHNIQTVLPIPKLKFTLFRNIRIKARFICLIERNLLLLSLIKKIKYRGKCVFRFTITLISEK